MEEPTDSRRRDQQSLFIAAMRGEQSRPRKDALDAASGHQHISG